MTVTIDLGAVLVKMGLILLGIVVFYIFVELIGCIYSRSANAYATKKPHIFDQGNRLRHKTTGKLWTVVESDLSNCSAIIKDINGKPKLIDWMTPAGTIRESTLNAFEKV